MLTALLSRLWEHYDPDLRAAAICLFGSAFTLAMMLPIADLANPYHAFGAAGTTLALLGSIATLVDHRRRRETPAD
ncbi:hypothetical protein EXE46_00465 [Halorubrum sp. GN11_10-6_MGM]|uniref:hypothetical protein n=1 Tax=Halorubrum sp. GN11_10-6_MGM TaxID=2518112 RepID=UPI0010F8C3DC|nr:hypothetical protein [Halorubrum sp. GN11_10-6_MGM]TKX76025.1 hypothetical protein EXE46_00465 [Halorubrum sp. GN11_10-6_MGM]